MKFKHVVLFGVVASIMSYLNSEANSEQDTDRQEEILGEIKELLDSDANELTIDQKLDEIKEEIPEHYEKAEEMAKDVSDDLIDELNSIVASLSSITEEVVDSFVAEDEKQPVELAVEPDTCDQEEPCSCEDTCTCEQEEPCSCECKESTVEETEEDAYRQNLIKDLEDLLSGIDAEVKPQPEVVTDEPDVETVETTEENTVPEIADLMEEICENEEPTESTEEEDLSEYTEDDFLRQIEEAIANATAGYTEELAAPVASPAKEECTNSEIDDIFADILNQENETPTSEPTEPTEEEEDAYLDELIDELKGDLETKPEPEVVETPVVDDVYARIQELYPGLNASFIRSVYNLKETIAEEYPLDKMVIILHRLSFKDLSNLQLFTDIVINHDYRVNVDENKMIVDILKEFRNTDGKILTNIFEVANQAKVLDGEYEGYHIEIE